MGIFNLFGGKKGEDDAAKAEQELAVKKEKTIEEIKEAHADLSWPVIQKINPVNAKGTEEVLMDETVSDERKDEIGPYIYEEEISADTIKSLSSQELLFLLTALEMYHKKSPLPGFEKNHRNIYNEVLGRVRDAEYLYVLYDAATGYPFIDHGFGNVYLEEEIANKAVELFAKQFRRLVVRKCKVENDQLPANVKRGFFDYLYYIGIDNLVVDNGAYRARFKRSEIVASPMDWNNDKKDASPVNPALNFAMLDFLGEVKWPVNYEKRPEIVKAKEMRMISLIRSGSFIVPMQHEGPVETTEDGRMKMGKDTKIKFLIVKDPNGKQFLPIYTDAIEFTKKLAGPEWNAAVFKYQDILKFVQDKDGISINPAGQGIMIPKDRMMAIEMAGQQVEAMKAAAKAAGAKGAAKGATSGNPEDDIVKSALNQAMAELNSNK